MSCISSYLISPLQIVKEKFAMVAPDVQIEDGKGTILISSEEGETEGTNLALALPHLGICLKEGQAGLCAVCYCTHSCGTCLVSRGALCCPQLQIWRVSGVDVPQGFTGLPVHR